LADLTDRITRAGRRRAEAATHKQPTMISKDSIEQTYAFFHQKWRVYMYSDSPVQRDDIEYAIAMYVQDMSAELYAELARGRAEYLLSHREFADDMAEAVDRLERML